MSQGHPEKAGTKHSIYRHLNTESGYYTVDEIALIPQIIANVNSSREVATPARKTETELAAERTQLNRNTAENAAKSVGEEVTV